MNKPVSCPECGGSLWDNTTENDAREQKGEKLRPDYSCKDKEGCGWVMWREKGKKKILVSTALPEPKKNGSETMMRLAYRKDLMVALVNTYGAGVTDQALKDLFNSLWSEVEK